ncbi:MAG TPA: ACP S-malonyltransferase [Candidatus Saccharimonadales bacterium]|nr:ACP S-malonyltransferase [Candidatus Saccharimonadales bacterium]
MSEIPIIIARNPGQGSQYQGMGEVAGDCAWAQYTFDEATEILAKDNRLYEGSRIDIRWLVTEADDETLAQNHLTQLAIFASTIAAQRRLSVEQPDMGADIWAGHSIGEYAGLVDAGVLSFEEALLLVDARARYMTSAGDLARAKGQEGGIGVVIGDPEAVERSAGKNDVYIANYNNPKQTGVSGAKDDLAGVKEEFGSRYIEIPVSEAVHSPFMSWAEYKLRNYIGDGHDFKDPAPETVVLNYTGRFAESGQEIAQNAPMQVTNPVMWLPGMELALIDYVDHDNAPPVILLEVGAKMVLSGIDKHFARSYPNVKIVTFEQAIKTGLDPESLAA